MARAGDVVHMNHLSQRAPVAAAPALTKSNMKFILLNLDAKI
jgi:hypothetical protein